MKSYQITYLINKINDDMKENMLLVVKKLLLQDYDKTERPDYISGIELIIMSDIRLKLINCL